MSDLERIRQYFTRSAVEFDSLYSEGKMSWLTKFINRRFRRDIYERFILCMNHVSKYKLETALDVGCGSGRYAYALAQLGVKQIVGIDCSQTMIDLAVKNTSTVQEADKIFDFICCDFLDFQTKESFGVTIAMGLFDYIKDPIPVLRKMKALANHSVIASFPSISIYRTPVRKIRYYFKQCPVYFYDYKKIVSLCTSVGFSRHKIVKIKGSGMDYFIAFYK